MKDEAEALKGGISMTVQPLQQQQQEPQPHETRALSDAIHRHGALVRHICRNILGDRSEDVEECAVDVFTAYWISTRRSEEAEGGKRVGFDPGSGSLENYLCGIARHKALDRYRKISGQPVFYPLDAQRTNDDGDSYEQQLPESLLFDPDFAAQLDGARAAELLVEALNGLSEQDRKIFVLRYWYVERIKAIAQKLGLSERVVKSRLYRGKAALRSALADKEMEDRHEAK